MTKTKVWVILETTGDRDSNSTNAIGVVTSEAAAREACDEREASPNYRTWEELPLTARLGNDDGIS